MNIVIVGQGAVGLLWYRYLSLSAANNVALLCSKNITKPPAYFTFTRLNNESEQVELSLASASSVENADLILICVKAFDVAEAIRQLPSFSHSNATIILCHNGMGITEKLAEQLIENLVEQLPEKSPELLPKKSQQTHTVLSMLLTHGAKLNTAFDVIHTGAGKADIGLVFGSLSDKKQHQLIATINNALPEVYWQEHIKQQQWEKLAINCVINPITAIDNINNGDVNQSQYDQIKKQTLSELVAIAHAEGIQLNSESLIKTVNQVASLTAENSSSMRSDLLAARTTEIDFINGYVHHLGIKHQIPTPQNSSFWRQIKLLEKRNK